ncbi:uncharacterized protein LOC132545266 [Ylistrum balloti]|uniref:uncharacterized protein LOC132545266 n=1 Tax=Ylistrum balloti TaxID=509963 RepID=UPI002905E595|nr:uncharacterized protein LOC132545266 [Ylistrum balloti]
MVVQLRARFGWWKKDVVHVEKSLTYGQYQATSAGRPRTRDPKRPAAGQAMGLMQCLLTLFLIWTFTTIHTGVAIDCWLCTSGDAGCGEVIDETTLQDNRKTASGCAACGKSFLALGTTFSSVERTCLTSASDTCDNKLGYGECTCSTTFCNGQSRTSSSTTFVLALCSVVTLVLRLIS